jgi:hypothetical protein
LFNAGHDQALLFTTLRMSESSNKEKMEEADDGAAQKNGSSSELKPLKRVVISGGLANEEDEKEALFGQLEESQVHVKHPASVSSIKNRKHKSSSDPTFVRRVASTATNDRGFERPASQLGSRKSLASVKTRTASVSRSEYHADLKLGLKAVSANLGCAYVVKSKQRVRLVFISFKRFAYNVYNYSSACSHGTYIWLSRHSLSCLAVLSCSVTTLAC